MSEDNLFPNGEASEMYIVYYVIQPSVPGERGVLSTMEGSTRKGYLFHASYERVEISPVEVFKREGPEGLTDEFYGFIKSRKSYIFVIDSYLKDKTFTAVKRDATF